MRISKSEMLRSIRRILNIGRTGLILSKNSYGETDLTDVSKEDWFINRYTNIEFIKKLEELEKEVEETWVVD